MRAIHRIKTIEIQTPEGVTFALSLAGPVVRFLAWITDLGCILALFLTVQPLVVKLFAIIDPGLGAAVGIFTYFVITVGYGIATEWWLRGQTLGKRLFRLRVLDVQGLRLRFSQVMIRNLLRAVDSLPLVYLVGGLACFCSRYGQRFGDYAANTIVVHQPGLTLPDLEGLAGGQFNSLRAYPHLTARLRQRVSPEEAGLALTAVMRRNRLNPDARLALFAELADHFKSIATFPPQAREDIPDEQYVRNVVDVLFRKEASSIDGRVSGSSPFPCPALKADNHRTPPSETDLLHIPTEPL
ncbi:MAG: RDD family protein [Desulfosarcina sp.]|nr:RDD family protein [Desulfobacterales bacterium]